MSEKLFSKLENMELEDARSRIDNMVVQAKLKICRYMHPNSETRRQRIC